MDEGQRPDEQPGNPDATQAWSPHEEWADEATGDPGDAPRGWPSVPPPPTSDWSAPPAAAREPDAGAADQPPWVPNPPTPPVPPGQAGAPAPGGPGQSAGGPVEWPAGWPAAGEPRSGWGRWAPPESFDPDPGTSGPPSYPPGPPTYRGPAEPDPSFPPVYRGPTAGDPSYPPGPPTYRGPAAGDPSYPPGPGGYRGPTAAGDPSYPPGPPTYRGPAAGDPSYPPGPGGYPAGADQSPTQAQPGAWSPEPTEPIPQVGVPYEPEQGVPYVEPRYGGSGYQPPGFGSAPYFPTTQYPQPARPGGGRRRGTVIAAVVAALVVVAGAAVGVTLLLTNHKGSTDRTATSTPGTTAPDTRPTTPKTTPPTTSAPATTAPPTTAAPTTTTSPTTVAPTTTTPPTTAAPTTTVPPTTAPPTTPPATVAPTLDEWIVEELSTIVQLKTSLTAVNTDLSQQSGFPALATDSTNLQSALTAAQGAGTPPDPKVAQEWSLLLSDTGTANSALSTAIQAQDPNVVADVASDFADADNDYNVLSTTLNQDVGQGGGSQVPASGDGSQAAA